MNLVKLLSIEYPWRKITLLSKSGAYSRVDCSDRLYAQLSKLSAVRAYGKIWQLLRKWKFTKGG